MKVVRQLVETAYLRAVGDLGERDVVKVEDLLHRGDSVGDTLHEFLACELGYDLESTDEDAAFDEALDRCRKVFEQVGAVYAALLEHQYARFRDRMKSLEKS